MMVDFFNKVINFINTKIGVGIVLGGTLVVITAAYGIDQANQMETIRDKQEQIEQLQTDIDEKQDKIEGLELDLDEAWRRETELRGLVWQYNDYMQKEAANYENE